MITSDQINFLSRKYKINESTIFREYLQILFLKYLYSSSESEKVYFKGGTAIHLLFKAPRFSEDLDFTVEMKENKLLFLIAKVFKQVSLEENVEIKERETIAGKRFLLTAKPSVLSYKTFVNLDFSFREKVLKPQKSFMETDYPLIFSSYIHHLSLEEICAEKVRAILTRKKGRDLYDLWYLLNKNVIINDVFVTEKLKYYHLLPLTKTAILKRIHEFSEKDFILDMKPFLPVNERGNLPKFYQYLIEYLMAKL